MPWSAVKQLRSVGETSASVGEVFDYFRYDFQMEDSAFEKGVSKHGQSEKVKAVLQKKVFRPFLYFQQDAISSVQYRMLSFPWYVILRQAIPSESDRIQLRAESPSNTHTHTHTHTGR